MGNYCQSCKFYRKPKNNITLLLTGLDNAGKTTIAKKLAGESIESVLKTVGFSLVVMYHRGFKITLYDLGGSREIRDIWNKYFMDAHGLVYVVDSSDLPRLEESRSIFATLLSHENISGKPVLLLANKQDTESALDELEIVESLNVESVVNQYRCPTRVEISMAYQPETSKIDKGIKNGFRWLINHVIQNYKILNERVKHDMAEYNLLVEKRKDEWRKKTETVDELEEEVYFENGNPFQAVDTVIKNSVERNRVTIQNGDLRKTVLVDNFVKEETKTSPTSEFSNFRVKAEVEVHNTFENSRMVKRKQKRNHRYHRHKRRFRKFNKTAPMPIDDILKLHKLSNGMQLGASNYSSKSCLTYGADEKNNRRKQLLPRRPATAPPKLQFSKIKVETAWDLKASIDVPVSSNVDIFSRESSNLNRADHVYF